VPVRGEHASLDRFAVRKSCYAGSVAYFWMTAAG
jgi:hypothetical protein